MVRGKWNRGTEKRGGGGGGGSGPKPNLYKGGYGQVSHDVMPLNMEDV